jgi:hypothetical protein
MKVITPGHKYAVFNMHDPDKYQFLQFIHKEPDPANPSQLRLVADGTTNEEVMAVLIDRLESLNAKMPCVENQVALANIRGALTVLNARTKKRQQQGIEGTAIPLGQKPTVSFRGPTGAAVEIPAPAPEPPMGGQVPVDLGDALVDTADTLNIQDEPLDQTDPQDEALDEPKAGPEPL